MPNQKKKRDLRIHRAPVNLTHAELIELRKRAKRAGLALAPYLRRIIFMGPSENEAE